MPAQPTSTLQKQLDDAMAIIREKNKALLSYKKQVDGLTKEQDDARTVRENIYKIAAYDPEPPEWTVREGRAGARGVPATIWSDWHYGEVVRMPGINTYDKTVAKRRIKHLCETTSTSPSTTWVAPRSPIPAALWLLGATCSAAIFTKNSPRPTTAPRSRRSKT
jgi:hypothetical protein